MHRLEAHTSGNDFTRAFFGAIVATTTLFVLLIGLSSIWSPDAIHAQDGQKQATVIVQTNNHQQFVREISFTGTISGLKALDLSGLDVITASTSFGPAVCSIAGVGCPAQDCFCNPAKFWSYSFWDGSSWQSYPVGAGSSIISTTGAIEGWYWAEFGSTATPAPVGTAAIAALNWLHARQVITDGSYGGAALTVESLLAIGANGLAAGQWRAAPDTASIEGAMISRAASYSRGGPAAAGKLAVALAASQACEPVGVLHPSDYFSPTLGAYSVQSGPQAWALLGVISAGETLPVTAVAAMRQQALANGGWEWGPGWGADTNATALAIQALVAVGEPISATSIISGLAFLKSTQNVDGGFPYAPASGQQPSPSDANSTAYVVQALIAAGEDPTGAAWTVMGQTPISYLLGLQLPDGSFEWQEGKGSNLLATQQAAPALLGQANPVHTGGTQACPTQFLPLIGR